MCFLFLFEKGGLNPADSEKNTHKVMPREELCVSVVAGPAECVTRAGMEKGRLKK